MTYLVYSFRFYIQFLNTMETKKVGEITPQLHSKTTMVSVTKGHEHLLNSN